MYLGTGESYTGGDASGNGIYKSTDGGNNWSLIYGPGASATVTVTVPSSTRVQGIFYVNDIALYDHDKNGGTDPHVFVALGSGSHSKMTATYLDGFEYGLYKSTNGGGAFNRITSINKGSTGASDKDEINDIEIQTVSNRIWLSTKSSVWSGNYGGRFWYSDDGSTFTKVNPTFPAYPEALPNRMYRTEIAPSHQDTDTHYVLMRVTGTASGTIPIIYKTTDNFTNLSYIVAPTDADLGIPDEDFTRGQSWYDLEIEVDPSNDNIIYVGGIDWFRSQNGGADWSQITKWSNNANLNTLNCSLVHADQHGLYFRPGNNNQAIVVNDGGVAYSANLANASGTSTFFETESGMITTQFYTVGQSPSNFAGDDWIIGGTQDNGSYALQNSNNNKTGGLEIQGGDGAESVFDQVGGEFYITNYVYNDRIVRGVFDINGNLTSVDFNFGDNLGIPDDEGSFINPGALDSNQNVYFSNAGTSIRVITDLGRGGTPATF